MNIWTSIAIASTFTWLGMVLAISFIEAPLKFRAPGITVQLGLGIGRLVFKALNTVEGVLAAVIVVALVISRPECLAVVALAIAMLALIGQVAGVRPFLKRRSNAVLADADGSVTHKRSTAHFYYTGLEIVKVIALVVGGFALLGG
ncbi:hypothetical protein [Mycolicibacterium brumae]|uniref:DUF4149 domain-containing protein n=1 Tax=Mycolicibacterium brumae TaxID=85968 RepID=A0A2G5PEG1_9MYCO|nr:hypothetical protein [Mycolicibacterium brumae]MCV7192077.1 hypothetical protein [Mycolicibacterium brumae]PIB76725.1 hypothetical protein CQY22_003475 [Mycolicibacterium brumae]RWA20742.1 hypothetical protein MBRU_03525 [Mycolicibacterium brumae DSM 44177]UWW07841.1 hypothetical protein L2Z93_000875 [Mycolicibacterium brumae]